MIRLFVNLIGSLIVGAIILAVVAAYAFTAMFVLSVKALNWLGFYSGLLIAKIATRRAA